MSRQELRSTGGNGDTISIVKIKLIGKGPSAGKDGGQEGKGATEDEMVGWDHSLNGHEFRQTLGDTEGQGSLACCSPTL